MEEQACSHKRFLFTEVISEDLDHFFLLRAAASPPAISPMPAVAMPIPMTPSKFTQTSIKKKMSVFNSDQRQNNKGEEDN